MRERFKSIRMLRISWATHVTNAEVFKRIEIMKELLPAIGKTDEIVKEEGMS